VSRQIPSAPRDRAGLLADLVREVQLAWHLWRDRRVPVWTKLIPLGAVLYVLFPLDIISDLFVGLGQLDDLAILILGMEAFISLSPAEVVEELRRQLRFGRIWGEAQSHASTVDSTARAASDSPTNQSGSGLPRPPAGPGEA